MHADKMGKSAYICETPALRAVGASVCVPKCLIKNTAVYRRNFVNALNLNAGKPAGGQAELV